MVKVRISQDDERPKRPEKPEQPKSEVVIREEEERAMPKPGKTAPAGPKVGAWRGMSERQWFISLLVASGLLLLLTFRGCILPSGVGPKTETEEPRQQQEQPADQPTDKAAGDTYTVQSGDTLGKIARQFDTTAQAIAEANDITVTTTLRVGQELKIP